MTKDNSIPTRTKRNGDHLFCDSQKVEIHHKRYEELIRAEETLKILCRVILEKEPYNEDVFRAVAEPYFPNREKNEV